MISLFKMAYKSSTEVLSGVPRYKMAFLLMEEIPMLGKLHSGMNYCAVGFEFKVNESRYILITIYIK